VDAAPPGKRVETVTALRVVGGIVLAAGAVYLVLLALFYFAQSRLLYIPHRQLTITPAEYGLEYENVRLRTSDGVGVHGWWVPSPGATTTVLFCHGNAGNLSHRVPLLAALHSLGMNALAFDYRGYGESEGSPGEAGTYVDAAAAWDHLVSERDIPPEEIVVFGRSLGGAVASHLARERSPRALILESTFTSVPDMARHLYPLLPSALARFRYAALQYIEHVDCPVLIIHGEADEIVPIKHGRRLYDAANGAKRLIGKPGGHNDGFLESDLPGSGTRREQFARFAADPLNVGE